MTKRMRSGYNGTLYKLEELYLSADLGTSWDHLVPVLDKRQKMDGWMDVWTPIHWHPFRGSIVEQVM